MSSPPTLLTYLLLNFGPTSCSVWCAIYHAMVQKTLLPKEVYYDSFPGDCVKNKSISNGIRCIKCNCQSGAHQT